MKAPPREHRTKSPALRQCGPLGRCKGPGGGGSGQKAPLYRLPPNKTSSRIALSASSRARWYLDTSANFAPRCPGCGWKPTPAAAARSAPEDGPAVWPPFEHPRAAGELFLGPAVRKTASWPALVASSQPRWTRTTRRCGNRPRIVAGGTAIGATTGWPVRRRSRGSQNFRRAGYRSTTCREKMRLGPSSSELCRKPS